MGQTGSRREHVEGLFSELREENSAAMVLVAGIPNQSSAGVIGLILLPAAANTELGRQLKIWALLQSRVIRRLGLRPNFRGRRLRYR